MKYRKNDNWSTHTQKCLTENIDDNIKFMTYHIESLHPNKVLDIVDISISIVDRAAFITIFYTIEG
jgi:hypothetical protein